MGSHKVAQSFPTISDPMDCSLPGSSAHGSFQAYFTLVVAVSRYFLADKLVTHITIEQFLPQKKPRHYEHVVLNVVDS